MSAIPTKITKIADERLVSQAQAGCQTSLNQVVSSYERLVYKMSQRYFLPGGDRQDIIQEGMVGLAHAIRNFDARYERKFFDYAVMCVRNSLVRAIRGANRKKQQVLNQAGEITEATYLACASNIDEQVVGRMSLQLLWAQLKKRLSPLETEVLCKRLADHQTDEIAAELNLSVKQIENALFRARQKSREVLAREEALAA